MESNENMNPDKIKSYQNMKYCYQLISYVQGLMKGPKEGNKPALNEIGDDFLTACIEEIERRGLSVEGLYRKPAVDKKVSELLKSGLKKKNRIFSLDLDEYDTKVLTNCVKLYLNSLPEALLTVVVYPSIIQSVRANDLNQLYNAIHKIPADNFAVLEKLIRHLHRIVQHSPTNLMTSKNLSKIFGHILLRPKAEDIAIAELAIEMLIENYDYIFNNGVLAYQSPGGRKHRLDKKMVKVFIGTWNVGNMEVSSDMALTEWLHVDMEKPVLPDVYVIGFQELDLSMEVILHDKSSREKEWLSVITTCFETLPENFTQVEVIRMLGIMMVIFVRDSLLPQISNVDKSRVTSGPLGNKGGVSIRFDLNRTSFCFVCCHFASHTEELNARNADFKNILNHTHFDKADKHIPDHELIFWFGDLNYRLDKLTRDAVLECISKKDFKALLQHDQLKNILENSDTVFPGFKEGEIDFKPTYKFVRPSLGTYAKHRVPAYCDRILWRGRHVRNYFYKSHDNFKLSDHKPVSGLFLCKIKSETHAPIVNLDFYQNKVLVDKRKLNFGVVKFMELFQDTIMVTNLKNVPVGFQFVDQVTLNKYFNRWIKISPRNGIIDPGEREDIVFTLQVTEESAAKLNSGEDVIRDNFFLRISGEKDTSIKINGHYKPSVFGFSMETLAKIRKPITQMSFKELKAIELKKHLWIGDAPIDDVPNCLLSLVDYLFQNGLKEENLFVRSGNYFEIIQIRDWLDSNKDLAQISVSAFSIAHCILLLLRSTKEPLIQILEESNKEEEPLVHFKMTEYNKFVVDYIISFLCFLLESRKENKLSVKVLAEVFADALIHAADVGSRKFMSTMIINFRRSQAQSINV